VTAPTALIVGPIRSQPWSYDVERDILAARGVRLVIPADDAETAAALPTADVILACAAVTAAHIDAAPNLAGILSYSVGMDGIDAAAAKRRGIPVWNCPTHSSDEVSDHAVALLLASTRRLFEFGTAAAAGDWKVYQWPQVRQMHRLRDSTLGIIGLGRIGSKVARKVHGFGVRVIASDPYVRYTPDPWVSFVSLDELLGTSDFIVLTASMTATSRNLLNAATLAKVRQCHAFINVARGAMVDEDALIAALDDGRIEYAALDVRAVEPPDPATDRLRGRANVLLTQHTAALSAESLRDVHTEAALQLLDLLELAGRIEVAVP
jgi:D-3-phosphoglycerate dehydrogenase